MLSQLDRSGDGDAADGRMMPRDGAALIAGTAIGGGFLALPAVTTPMGFAPSALCLVVVWSFLVLTGCALIESADTVLEQTSGRDTSGGEPQPVSFASLTAFSFGPAGSLICSGAFIAQMLAVLTAQARARGAQCMHAAAHAHEPDANPHAHAHTSLLTHGLAWRDP